MSIEESIQIQDSEMNDLIRSIFKKYGYDFSDYSAPSFKRRISKALTTYGLSGVNELIEKILDSEYFFTSVLEDITVNITEMFRDPDFYKTLRKDVIPQLSTYPLIRIWHAGCSTGEEVFSMAILLKEAGILDKSILYATDINQKVLEKAASAQYSLGLMPAYEANYQAAGGIAHLKDYYEVKNETAVFNKELRDRMVFSPHNLVIDQSFNEFNLILCRNVLIYFNRNLQNRVLQLFSDSLPPKGFLALGTKESVYFSDVEQEFEPVSKTQRIWQKIS